MTNEELAIMIQNGKTEYADELWEQVRNFVAQKANRLAFNMNGRRGITVDDLINTGFIAMHKACTTYSPGKGTFLHWLEYYLKTSFAYCCGYRTSRRDALDLSESLDCPLDTSNFDSNTLGDMVPDPKDQYSIVEDKVYNTGLHMRLDALIGTLPPAGAQMIRAIYWSGETTAELSKHMGISEDAVRTKKGDYMQKLRRSVGNTGAGRRLRAYIEENTQYYTSVGVSQFRTTHISAVEKIVFMREKLEREITGNVKKKPYICHTGRERDRR